MFLINKEWQLSFIPIFLRNYFYAIKQILHTVLWKSTFAGTQEIAFRFCRNCFRQIIFSNFFFKYKIFLSLGRKINAAVSIRRFALCGFLIRLCLLFFFDRRCFTLLRIPIFSCGRKYFPLSARYSLKLRDFFLRRAAMHAIADMAASMATQDGSGIWDCAKFHAKA